jgi:hypothetical protein
MFNNSENLSLPTYLRVLMPDGHVEEMKLETYLAGVVAAQIGANAPLEALKAQAVASRTYAVAMRRHPDQNADVCIGAHCQKWKRVDPVSAPEVFRALGETWGLVAIHNGALINAVYFEHCDGRTRNSEDMLMDPLPYLRAVDCSCGFLTLKGHGVGMCMRGAIVLARRGATFEQILQHYYRGVQVFRAKSDAERVPVREEATPVHAPVKTKPARARKKMIEPEAKPARAISKHVAPPPSVQSIVETKPSVPAEPRKPIRVPGEPPAPIVPPSVTLPAPTIAEPAREPAVPIIESAEPAPAIKEPVSEPVAPREPAPIIAEPIEEMPPRVESEPAPVVPTEVELPALEENIVRIERRYQIDQLPGARMIAGCLDTVGVPIVIQEPNGNTLTVYSGSAKHYGAGGFETLVNQDGVYRVMIDGQTIEVKINGETVFIHGEHEKPGF